jgi:hypothetical protein
VGAEVKKEMFFESEKIKKRCENSVALATFNTAEFQKKLGLEICRGNL